MVGLRGKFIELDSLFSPIPRELTDFKHSRGGSYLIGGLVGEGAIKVAVYSSVEMKVFFQKTALQLNIL